MNLTGIGKEDGYADLARKAAEPLDITVPDSGALVLLRPASGAVIPTQLKDDKVSWTLGGFLRQHHLRADKVEVGVACAVEASKVCYYYGKVIALHN